MLKLLEKVANALIKKYKPLIICVTGSVGKTSTKEAIYSAVSVSYRTRKTSRNYNNDYGVPISVIGGYESEEGFLALLGILLCGLWQLYFWYKFPEVLVIEVGAGKIGEIERIAKWLKPKIVVVTNLPDKPSHLGIFGSKEMVIREKKFLVDAMDKDGILFIDKNEANSESFYNGFSGEIVFYDGDKSLADSSYSVIYDHEGSFFKPTGFKIETRLSSGETTTLTFKNFLGQQNVKAVTIALLVAEKIGCKSAEMLAGIQKYRPECGRLRIIPGKNDLTVIDDSFNSSPVAVINSLKTLLSLKKASEQRYISVLGDMHKLGKEAPKIHEETGVNEIPKVDILITVGNLSEAWQKFNSNLSGLNRHFKNATNAAKYIQKIQKPGDLIHFKGGHLTRLEKAVSILTNCHKKDLVRQEKYYKNPELELNQEWADGDVRHKSKITLIFKKLAQKYRRDFYLDPNIGDTGHIVGTNGKRHPFSYGTIDLNDDTYLKIATDKVSSSNVIRKVGIRLPKEKVIQRENFNSSGIEEAVKFTGLPAIIKPIHGAQGKNIFKVDSVLEIQKILRKIDFDNDDLIVQEYIDSPYEIRIVLLDGKVIQAYLRDYAHIIGNGIGTIRELIEDKNDYFKSRARNTVIAVNDPQIQNILENKKLNLESVLKKNERLNLSYGRNLSRGGEYEFVEKKLSRSLIQITQEIGKVSGLRLVGLDLFLSDDVQNIREKYQVSFIEYNGSPDMENNFYYDGDYGAKLEKIYETIFKAMI